MRYVAPRPRKVIIELTASTDSRWKALQSDIDAFLEKVKRGDDLTPAASAQGPNVDRWADKDMLLNVMGQPRGFARRMNEILFAHVTREEFAVVAIFYL